MFSELKTCRALQKGSKSETSQQPPEPSRKRAELALFSGVEGQVVQTEIQNLVNLCTN